MTIMRSRSLTVAFVTCIACMGVALPAAAARSPCDARPLAEGPLPTGYSQGDFGIVRGACPRSEVGVAVTGRAIVENENFYGNLRGASRVDASVLLLPQLEAFATLEPIAYQLVIQSYRADHLGLGDASLGGKLLAFARDDFALSVTTRLHVPTALGYYANSWPWALDAGVLLLLEPVDDLRLRAGLLGAVRWAASRAGADARPAVIANAGADVVMLDWLALALDLDGQALERGALDVLDVGVGLRFAFTDALGLELGARIPVAGDERNLTSAVLRASWRLE